MPAIDAQVFLTNEGTPGTEQTPPAATDVIDFHACTFAAQGDILRRPVVRAHQDRLPPKRVPAKHWQIALETEVKAATAAGTAPELDLLFKSAGFDDTINAGVSVVYALRDDPISVVDAALTVRKEMTLDGITVIGTSASSRISVAVYCEMATTCRDDLAALFIVSAVAVEKGAIQLDRPFHSAPGNANALQGLFRIQEIIDDPRLLVLHLLHHLVRNAPPNQ